MKTSLPSFSSVLCAAALALGALPVMGQGPSGSCGGGPRGEACGNLAGLTDAQRTTLSALEAKHRPALEEKRRAADEAHLALQQALAKSSTDRTVLKGLFDKDSQARFNLAEARQALRQETEKILTPEQKAQWDQRRGDGSGMGRGRRGGMGSGRADGMSGGMGRGMGHGMGMGDERGMGMGMGMGRDEGSCPGHQH